MPAIQFLRARNAISTDSRQATYKPSARSPLGKSDGEAAAGDHAMST